MIAVEGVRFYVSSSLPVIEAARISVREGFHLHDGALRLQQLQARVCHVR